MISVILGASEIIRFGLSGTVTTRPNWSVISFASDIPVAGQVISKKARKIENKILIYINCQT